MEQWRFIVCGQKKKYKASNAVILTIVRRGGLGLLLAGLSFVLYLASLSPSMQAGDSAELAMGVYSQGIVHPPGYPLYLVLARIWTLILPFGDFASRLNAFSAFTTSLTMFALFTSAKALTQRNEAALLGVALFAFTGAIWQEAIHTEVYSLHIAIVSFSLLSLIKSWHPALIFFFFGLGLAHHLAMVLVLVAIFPCFAYQYRHNKLKLLKYAPLMALPSLIYLYLPIRFAASPSLNMLTEAFNRDLGNGSDLLWFIRGAIFYPEMFNYQPIAYFGELGKFLSQLTLNYLGIGIIFGIRGIVALWGKDPYLTLSLVGLFFGQVLFFSGYNVIDKWSMFHTAWLVWALFLASGFKRFLEDFPWVSQKLAYALAFTLISAQILINWQLIGREGTSINIYQAALEPIEGEALVIGDWQPIRQLEYLQMLEGRYPDLDFKDMNWMLLALRDSLGTNDYASLQTALSEKLSHLVNCSEQAVYLLDSAVYIPDVRLEQLHPRLFRLIPLGDCEPS
jgi:hypothetical protein